MEETKISANLPNLDVELVRVEDPDAHAEVVTIKMTATPSFQAVGNYVSKTMFNPMTMWAMPLGLWSGMVTAAWRPWLAAFTPQLAKPDDARIGRAWRELESKE